MQRHAPASSRTKFLMKFCTRPPALPGSVNYDTTLRRPCKSVARPFQGGLLALENRASPAPPVVVTSSLLQEVLMLHAVRYLLLGGVAAVSFVVHAQHQPYAGQDAREIKALSAEEVQQYL